MSVVLLGSTSGSVTLQEPAIAGSTVIDLPATSGTMAVLPTATSVLPEASGGTGTTTGYYGFKNRIINGAMVIDQRNAGASVSVSGTTSGYCVDRFQYYASGGGAYTLQRSTVAPVGFTNSLLVTVTTADASIAAGDYYWLQQQIEGFNIADLAWGSASAATIAVSFWVRSSLTGTFSGGIENQGTGGNRGYAFNFTINAANTLEYKTVIIPGDVAGTWLTDNSTGLSLTVNLGCGSSRLATAGAWVGARAVGATGSVSLISTVGATFYITGVQLEKGSTATSFDYRPYGTELALCQRYYQYYGVGASTLGSFGYGRQTSTTSSRIFVSYPPMRATPTVANSGGSMDIPNSSLSLSSIGTQYLTPNGSGFFDVTTTSGGVAGGSIAIQLSTGNYFSLTSEL